MNLIKISEVNLLCSDIKRLIKLVKQEVWAGLPENALASATKAKEKVNNLGALIVNALKDEEAK